MSSSSHLPTDRPALPSNQRFGALFTAVFLGLAAYGAWRHWPGSVWMGLAVLGVLTGAVTLVHAAWLQPFNRAWAGLGLWLGKVVSPLVLGALYFLLLTPLALALRASGRDELALRRRERTSHWIERQPPGPDGESFRNQY